MRLLNVFTQWTSLTSCHLYWTSIEPHVSWLDISHLYTYSYCYTKHKYRQEQVSHHRLKKKKKFSYMIP